MSEKIIFLKPFLKPVIWGGTKIKEFNYDLKNSKNIGEAWAISAYPKMSSEIISGEFKGKDLLWLWENHSDLFHNAKNRKYPLLCKIIDANDNLSVQVHPDKAQEYKPDIKAKNECWYILDCPKDAQLVYCHNARDKNELSSLIKNKEWKTLLKYKKIKKGDFIYVPAGTVHAITKGTMVYELQQSSDTTYRLYDYDRTDKDGHHRELHIDQSIDCITYLDQEHAQEKANGHNNYLVDNDLFKLFHLSNEGNKHTYSFERAKWLQVTIIDGKGKFNGEDIKKGDNLIAFPDDSNVTIEGKATLLISYETL